MKRFASAVAVCLLMVLGTLAYPWQLGGQATEMPGVAIGVPALAAAGAPQAFEVRLRFIPRRGWLPDGGLNVYRADGRGGFTKLNSEPIKPRGIKPDILGALKTPSASGKQNFRMDTVVRRFPSASVFTGIKADIAALAGGSALLDDAHKSLSVSQSMRGYQANLVPVAAKQNSTAKASGPLTVLSTKPTGDDLRARFVMGALSNAAFAAKSGLAFTDTTPGTGSVAYTIRAVQPNGTEIDFATTTVSVNAASATPPGPANLDVLQTAEDTVDLHWDDPSGAVAAGLGLKTYNVVRSTSQNLAGTQLNDRPIAVAYLKQTDGTEISNPISYRDQKVPLTTLTYKVTLTDGFGRQSAPASVSINVANLAIPYPIVAISAHRWFGNPHVFTHAYNGPPTIVGFARTAGIRNLKNINGQLAQVEYGFYRRQSDEIPKGTDPVSQGARLNVTTGPADVQKMLVSDLVTLYGESNIKPLFAGVIRAFDRYNAPSADTMWQRVQASTLSDVKLHYLADITTASQNLLVAEIGTTIQFTDDSALPVDSFVQYYTSANFSGLRRISYSGPSSWIASPLLGDPPEVGSVTVAKPVPTYQGQIGFYNPTANKLVKAESAVFAKHFSVLDSLSSKNLKSGQKVLNPVDRKKLSNLLKLEGSQDQAWTVKISWPTVTYTKDMQYVVYRGIATGFQGPANNRIFNYHEVPSDITSWQRLGQTPGTSWTDTLAKSYDKWLTYRVFALSRWGRLSQNGVDGSIAIPATLTPTPPSITSLIPKSDGSIVLTWKPTPAEQVVTKYLVARYKVLPPASPSSGSTTPTPTPVTTTRKIFSTGFMPLSSTNPGTIRFALHKSMRAKGGGSTASSVASILAHAAKPSISGAVKAPVDLSKLPTEVQAVFNPESYFVIGTVPQGAVNQPLSFTDPAPDPASEFVYQVYAVSQSSISSPGSNIMDAKPVRTHADPISSGTAKYAEKDPNGDRSVVLTWMSSIGDPPVSFIIQRQIGPITTDASGKQILPTTPVTVLSTVQTKQVVDPSDKSTSPTHFMFADTFIRTNKRYTYSVIAVDAAGLLSPPVYFSSDLVTPFSQ